MTQYKRLVVKLGTSVLTNGTPRLYRPQIVELVRQCATLHHAGVEVIICTSGAIAAGHERLSFPDLPSTVTNNKCGPLSDKAVCTTDPSSRYNHR